MSNSSVHGISRSREGFHKWVRMPVDDLPLIRPPRRHMLGQMTGGLKELHSQIKKSRSRPGSSQKESPVMNCLKRLTASDSVDRKLKGDIHNKDSKSFKFDDEYDRVKCIENEETSLYTDEEGEFVPSKDMPLLAHRYKYVNVLARGQSALIIKALDTFAKNKPIAIKVLHRVYKPIGSQEADILIELDRADPWCHVPFTRLKNQFIYGPHYCLVFESLSPTPLYTHYKQKNVKGAESIPQIQNLCIKLLSVLGFLHKQNVIHADFKPENILLRDENDMNSVTVIDFGNSLRNTEEELSLYYSDFELQTLLYRAPEVMFGLKFSLQIDLWSLGCLLAECFIGQPLFIGKTKHDMLSKITKLLGPFPKEFSDGDCARNFKEFIGTPLSQYQRVENLKKKLNCKNTNFLLLLERLLAYSPQMRINPFEAASHSFVAKINPFLYLSSAGEKCYPSILLNSETYPHLPNMQTSGNEDQFIADCRTRLSMYSNRLQINSKTPVAHTASDKQDSARPLVKEKPSSVDSKIKNLQASKKELPNFTPFQQKKAPLDVAPQFDGNSKFMDRNDRQKEINAKQDAQESNFTPFKESMPLRSPDDISNDKLSIGSPEMQHSFTSESSMQSPTGSPPLFNSTNKIYKPQINTSVEITRQGNKSTEKSKEPPQGDVSRTDVKQTLKSMGLRCEDFTISVYSKEQAHAILRRQGVEVTNHNQNKINVAKPPNRLPKVIPNLHPSVSVLRRDQQAKAAVSSEQQTKPTVPTEQQMKSTIAPEQVKTSASIDSQVKPTVPNDQAKSAVQPDQLKPAVSDHSVKPGVAVDQQVKPAAPVDNDDDDCVILDPPEGHKNIPPQKRFPQQFQLMGTTVQVSRGAKRPLRGMPIRIPAKRGRPAYYNFYNEARQASDENSEASVQDTLNRLKNYNISITCKRNTTQLNQPKPYYKEEESENSDSNSDEEQDLAKYLECEIKEKFQDEAEDTDGPKANSCNNALRSPEERDNENNTEAMEKELQDEIASNDSKCVNDEDEEEKQHPECTNNGVENSIDESDNIKTSTPLVSPNVKESKSEDYKSPSIDDDDINEELEKQLLESPNFGKELDDMEDECLDSLEKI